MSLIVFDNVVKQINNQITLNKFNLKINKNDRIGIKLTHEESSVLFDLIMKTVKPTSGNIQVHSDPMIVRSDDGFYDELTVKGYLNFFSRISGNTIDIVSESNNFFLSDILNKKIKTLSIDEKERLNLFRIFLFSPELVFVESPLHNLTSTGIELYLKSVKYLRSVGTTIVFTSFYTEELSLLSSDIYHYVNDTLEEINFNDDFKISSRSQDGIIYFKPKEIDFIESINGTSNLRVNSEYYPTNLTMDQLETKLVDFVFFRCHRSYLVNLQRISKLVSYSKNSYSLVLKGDDSEIIPLSRTKLDRLKKLMK